MLSGTRRRHGDLFGRDQAMHLPQTGGCQCGKLRYEISEARYWF
jgi:hypothetical protein